MRSFLVAVSRTRALARKRLDLFDVERPAPGRV